MEITENQQNAAGEIVELIAVELGGRNRTVHPGASRKAARSVGSRRRHRGHAQ